MKLFMIILTTACISATVTFAGDCSNDLQYQQMAAELAISSPGTPGPDVEYSKRILSTIDKGGGDDCETLQRVKDIKR